MAEELIQIGCYVTAQQLAGLKALSAETRAPMTVFIRLAIDQLLAEHSLTPKKVHGAKLNQRIAAMRGRKP